MLPPPLELMHLFVRLGATQVHSLGSDKAVKKKTESWSATDQNKQRNRIKDQGCTGETDAGDGEPPVLSGKTIPRDCMRYLGIR